MGNWVNKIVASKFWWVMLLVILLAVNYLASTFHARFDLTKEKRYTLTKATKDLLKGLDEDVQIDVFLKGDFPAGFKKLANSAEEFLGLLKDRNSSKIHYRFISPQEEMPDSRKSYGDSLVGLGAVPINLTVQKEEGESSNIIFPVALMRYKGKQSVVSLYPGASGAISQDEINSAEALMEYQFAKTLDKMTEQKAPAIIYATGNGQPTDYRVYDIEQTLTQDYRFGPFDISKNQIPGEADVLLIVKPTIQFTEEIKLKIDQFIMRGGKVVWFIDNLIAEQDSLRFTTETIAFDRDLNLTDQLFRYGVRINPDLVMSLDCDYMPFAVGGTQENPQFEFLKWNYYPLFGSPNNNPVTKNMGLVMGRFVNSIDTIATPGITKTVLLSSSPNSRIISTPALISLNENKNVPQDAKFTKNNIPVAMLLEGKFTSLFRNKISKNQLDSLAGYGIPYMEMSKEPGKMIVVGDGDILLNEVSPKEGPLRMGTNFYTMGSQYEYQFANKEFLLNCIEYLVNKPGIIETRNKDIVLRLLDSQKVKAQKSTWQFMNIALPILLVLLFGWIYQQVRKRKYAA
ncbi:gliding motility-associated ABC transporter substrate-binding protein GldG [Chitinophagaceae bacterium IBVUCB2]|nr:gliding motility-associated ABC transporter substrate-binding protein GldG [Chitinophagaceae bacterium IBVUCB2]